MKGSIEMNIAAIASMETFARTVLKLSPEGQNIFFESLADSLSAEEIETLKKCVASYKLMTSVAFYRAAQQAVGEQLYKEFNS